MAISPVAIPAALLKEPWKEPVESYCAMVVAFGAPIQTWIAIAAAEKHCKPIQLHTTHNRRDFFMMLSP
jgi:hypothetical protein